MARWPAKPRSGASQANASRLRGKRHSIGHLAGGMEYLGEEYSGTVRPFPCGNCLITAPRSVPACTAKRCRAMTGAISTASARLDRHSHARPASGGAAGLYAHHGAIGTSKSWASYAQARARLSKAMPPDLALMDKARQAARTWEMDNGLPVSDAEFALTVNLFDITRMTPWFL